MWAHTLTAPYRFERQDVPAPREADLLPGEVLVRVLAGGICGSDTPIFAGAEPARGEHQRAGPGTAGAPMHEVVGDVVASRDPEIRTGARVVGWASRNNALAEYVVTAGEMLFEPDGDLPTTMTVVLQPLACVMHALSRLPDIEGARAAVIGQGPFGMLFSHGLKSLGARSVTGVDRVNRTSIATTFGVDETVHAPSATWAANLDDAARPDIIIEAVGHQVSTLTDAVTAVADFGQIYYFGIPDDLVYPFPMLAFLRKNAVLRSGATRNMRAALGRAAQYLSQHPMLAANLVTHVLSIDDVQEGFELAARPTTGQLKIVFTTE
jgi:threonine dehydrogenase-like Zn-dependent dehydrogenase